MFSFSEAYSSTQASRTFERIREESKGASSLKRLKKIASEKLEKKTKPMVFIEVDMSHVIACRKKHKGDLGFIPFIIRAFIAALTNYPEVQRKKSSGISIALGSGSENIVSLFSKLEDVSTLEIEQKLKNLGRKILNSEEQGMVCDPTFTILNAGSFGSLYSIPKLFDNQLGILCIHDIANRVEIGNKSVSYVPKMSLTFSYDYRIIDGKFAAPLLARVKELLEDPAWFDL